MTVRLANETGLLEANTFGSSSPNKRISKVNTMICNVIANSSEIPVSGAASIAIVTATIEAATLKIVFPINIVTNKRRGVSRSDSIYFNFSEWLLNCFFIFLLSSENNATSEPEKKADAARNITRMINLTGQSISNQSYASIVIHYFRKEDPHYFQLWVFPLIRELIFAH